MIRIMNRIVVVLSCLACLLTLTGNASAESPKLVVTSEQGLALLRQHRLMSVKYLFTGVILIGSRASATPFTMRVSRNGLEKLTALLVDDSMFASPVIPPEINLDESTICLIPVVPASAISGRASDGDGVDVVYWPYSDRAFFDKPDTSATPHIVDVPTEGKLATSCTCDGGLGDKVLRMFQADDGACFADGKKYYVAYNLSPNTKDETFHISFLDRAGLVEVSKLFPQADFSMVY